MMLKIGEIFFKFRDYTPIPIVIAIVVFASATLQSLIIGSVFAVLGELIRFLGVSHIGGVSRTRSFSTGQKLIVTGPFSHVRNPLYIGNFFLSFGLVVLANVSIYLNVAFVLFFFLQYLPIVNWEEENLLTVFGEEFEEYRQKVPRWIPTILSRIESQEEVRGAYGKALRSERNTLLAAVLLYALILWRSGWLSNLPHWV